MNCLSVFDHFVGLALKGVMVETKFGNDPLQKELQRCYTEQLFEKSSHL